MGNPFGFAKVGPQLAALLLIAACGTTATTEDTTTTTMATTTTAPATTTTEEATTTTAATTQPEASEQTFDFAVPFTATLPSNWRVAQESAPRLLYLERGRNLVAFSTFGPETVEEWRSRLTEDPNLVVTEPEAAEIDGAEGFRLDATVSDEAGTEGCFGQGRCVTLIEQFPGWIVLEGLPNRIWVVDVAGTAVFIVAEASDEDAFGDFVAQVDEFLATLTWGREA